MLDSTVYILMKTSGQQLAVRGEDLRESKCQISGCIPTPT